MGACVSSASREEAGVGAEGGGGGWGGGCGMKSPLTVKVVHLDGRVQEFRQPIPARNLTFQNPNCFLCSSESMSIGTSVPQVPEEEELQPGQIYFLLPLSQSHKCLFLSDFCALAIKASSGLAKNDSIGLISYPTKPMLIFK